MIVQSSSSIENIPQPLQHLLDRVHSLCRSESSLAPLKQSISSAVTEALLDAGATIGEVQKSVRSLIDSFGAEIRDEDSLDEAIFTLYEHHKSLIDTTQKVTLVVGRTIRDNSDMRIAIRTLQSSPGYTTLRKEKIWTLGGGELKARLESEPCSTEGNHWYVVLARIMRFRDPEAMVSTGAISAPALRDFLCDFVFLVPREAPVRKKPSKRKKIKTSEKVRKKSLQNSGKTPPSTYRDLLTPRQREASDLRYGWDGKKYDIARGIRGTDIARKRDVSDATISILLAGARKILWKDGVEEISPKKETLQKEPAVQPPQFIEPKSNGGHKQNSATEEVHVPAFLKNRRVVAVTRIPKRESPKPTYHIPEQAIVPKPTERPKFQTVVVKRPIAPTPPEEIPEVPEVTPAVVSFPETLGYEAGLEWLRNEPSVKAGLDAVEKKIPAYTRDDLSIMALFAREYPFLHTAFTRLRKMSNHSCLGIMHDMHNPDPLFILKRESEVIARIKACFRHHQTGENEQFTHVLREISHDANIAGKVIEICDKYEANGFIEGLALVIDLSWTAEDDEIYETVSLRDTLQRTNGFSSLMGIIDRLPSDVKLRDLQKKLNSLSIKAVPGATSWPRYKSSQTTSMTLLALLETLIKQDKGDETSTKQLRRKLKQVVDG